MGIIKYFRDKRKAENNKHAVNKFNAVENLINANYMKVDPENYHVAMLDNLWTIYNDETKINFCASMKYYCNLQNAYNGHKVDKKAKLLISLKYENDNVLPYAYFDGKKITLYQEEKEN